MRFSYCLTYTKTHVTDASVYICFNDQPKPVSNFFHAMKTNLIVSVALLAWGTVAQAQDFRALPPAEQPNTTELAYFGGRNPSSPVDNASDAADIQLVRDFLTDLTTGQFEAAHNRLAGGFLAYGPGDNDRLKTDDLLSQWDRNGRLFPGQHLAFETITPVTVTDGDSRGQWVYVKGTWSAPDGRGQGSPIRLSFHHLALVSNNRIQRTYTNYGNGQLFTTTPRAWPSFPLYLSDPMLRQNEVTQKR